MQWQVSRDHKRPGDWTEIPDNNKKVRGMRMLGQKRINETIMVILKNLKCYQGERQFSIQRIELGCKKQGSNL